MLRVTCTPCTASHACGQWTMRPQIGSDRCTYVIAAVGSCQPLICDDRLLDDAVASVTMAWVRDHACSKRQEREGGRDRRRQTTTTRGCNRGRSRMDAYNAARLLAPRTQRDVQRTWFMGAGPPSGVVLPASANLVALALVGLASARGQRHMALLALFSSP